MKGSLRNYSIVLTVAFLFGCSKEDNLNDPTPYRWDRTYLKLMRFGMWDAPKSTWESYDKPWRTKEIVVSHEIVTLTTAEMVKQRDSMERVSPYFRYKYTKL